MSADKLSKLELFYQTQSVFKRNRRYLDNDSMDKLKSLLEKQRRMPDSRSLSTRDRFDSSFHNSKHTLHEKLAKDIQRFKGRMSMSRVESFEDDKVREPQTTRSSLGIDSSVASKKYEASYRRIKGIPLNLTLPRKDLIEQSKDPLDERLFNNFKMQIPNTAHTVDFSKRRGRHERSKSALCQQPTEELSDISKKHEQFYYKETAMKCLFNYKVQKDNGGRVWMYKRRKEDICDNDINPERVKNGIDYTSGYESTKTNPFYNNSGRELPPTLQMRQMNANQNYYVNTEGKIDRPELQFNLRQQRNLLKERRLMEIRNSKKPMVEREHVCMEVYFRKSRNRESGSQAD